MEFSQENFFVIAIILSFGSFVQSVVGFAFGLITIPLMILYGVSLELAAVAVSTATFLQCLVGSYRLWSHIKLSEVVPASVLRAVVMPIGIYVMYQITELDPGSIKKIVGIVILSLVVIQLFVKLDESKEQSKFWSFTAFASSGFLIGAVGMGGPPLVIWLMAQKWSGKKVRAFLFFSFLSTAPLQIFLLERVYGQSVIDVMLYTIYCFPVLFLVSSLGFRVGDRLPSVILRRITYALLVVISVCAVVKG